MARSKMWVVIAALVGMLAPPLMLLVWAEEDTVVQDGMVVLMEFTITVPESQLVIPKNVSQFTPGHNELLPNLEKAITGMSRRWETETRGSRPAVETEWGRNKPLKSSTSTR